MAVMASPILTDGFVLVGVEVDVVCDVNVPVELMLVGGARVTRGFEAGDALVDFFEVDDTVERKL